MIAAAIYFVGRAPSCDLHAVARALVRHPAVTSLGLVLVGGGILGLSLALVRRHWAAGTGAVLAVLCGSLWIAGVAGGAIDSCATLRPLAETVRARIDAGDSVLFFREPLPAVALYSERRIPTLRDPQSRPEGTFYLIVPDSRGADMPKDWRDSGRSVAEVYGRAFTRQRMTVRLLRLPPVTEPTR